MLRNAQDIEAWREGLSMMLMELISTSDADTADQIASTIEGQLERVIDLAPND
tara:strand:- start:1055 stop:1213 length:159 start_codon:yes stop_codon:yes gene_type:complete